MHQKLIAWYRQHKVLTWIIVGLVICYHLAGFVVAPMVTGHLLEGRVSDLIHRKIEVRKVRFNPYTFTLALAEVSVADPDGSGFVDVKELSINAQPLASLFRWGVVVQSVFITEPVLRIARTGTAQFNFSDLLAPGSTAADSGGAVDKGQPPRVMLHKFKLVQGRIDFSDPAVSSPFRSTLSSIEIALSGLDSKAAAGPAAIHFSARSESSEQIAATGQVDLSPLDVTAELGLDNLQIPKYSPYYGPLIAARLSQGSLTLKGRLQWSADRRSVEDIHCVLTQFAMASVDGDQALVHLPEFKITGAGVDIDQRDVQLGRVTSRDGKVMAARDEHGVINLLAAFAPSPVGEGPTPGAAHDSAVADSAPWVVRAPQVDMEGFSVHFQDARAQPPADLKLANIAVTAREMTTRQDAKGTVVLKMDWADQGHLAVEGDVGLMPFQARLNLDARDLDIRPLQPYINDHVQLVVTRGNFSTKGQVQIVPFEIDLDLRYRGQASLNAFQSVDPKQSGDFVKWKSLFLSGLELDIAPFRLLVDEVALTDFFNRLIIFKDGTSNLQAIMASGGQNDPADDIELEGLAASGQPSPSPGPDIRINTVTLQGGKVDFSDLFIKPNVRLPMSAIGGRISNLDAVATHRADVLLRGMVNANVPMEIKGQVNPFIAKPYVDLKLDFAGIDLSPFTPYSGKYLGYTLDKGQLSLNLSYMVADNKLTGKNKVLLKQLTLGQSVPSDTATKLPIKFAIALLKDGKGNIDLDLPVSGDLDDPEFSVAGIVLKMFANLIVNIVTSPFKMLGALFGGGEELAYLNFEPGAGHLPEGSGTKLDSLAKILTGRPGLKLEIQGQVDQEKDLDGLRRIRFEQDLKSAKLKSLSAKGQTAVALEQIVLTAEEREPLILDAYAAAQFPKPRDEKGRLKRLMPTEMEKLLYTAIVLTDDDLRLLAHQRASAAKHYLLETARLKPDRLFVIEPKIAARDQDEEQPGRVKFNLK